MVCYIDDVLYIIDNLMATMEGIQQKFKLKDDKVEPLDMYLGVGLTKM